MSEKQYRQPHSIESALREQLPELAENPALLEQLRDKLHGREKRNAERVLRTHREDRRTVLKWMAGLGLFSALVPELAKAQDVEQAYEELPEGEKDRVIELLIFFMIAKQKNLEDRLFRIEHPEILPHGINDTGGQI